MAAFTIRIAGPADRAFIEDLGRRTVRSSVASFRDVAQPLLESSFERLVEIVCSQSHVALIACEGQVAVGFLLMLDQLPDEVTAMPQGFVAYTAVEPERRGRGAAKMMLEAAEDEARKRGLPYMGLMVTEENAAARALYDRAGYVTERRLLCKPL